MKRTDLGLVVVMFFALAFERSAYYGARSLMALDFIQRAGFAAADVGSVLQLAFWVGAVATIAGGALAIALGVRVVAIVGAVTALLAYVLLAVGIAPTAAALLASLGSGLFRPCPLAVVAEELSPTASSDGPAGDAAPPVMRSYLWMCGVACCFYGLAVNLPVLLATHVTQLVREEVGFRGAFALAVVTQLGCLGASGVALFFRRAPSATASAPERPASGLPIAGLAILGLLAVPFAVAQGLPWDARVTSLLSRADSDVIFMVNPIVVIVVTLLGAGSFFVASAQRWAITPVMLFGGGALLFGVGLAPMVGATSVGAYLAGAVINALGESLTGPIGYAYAALAPRPRFAALSVALWIECGAGYGVALTRAAPDAAPISLGYLFVLLFVVGGIALLVTGRRLQSSLFDAA